MIDDFIDNGDGTVTDMVTGLMWQQLTVGKMNWEDAIAYCENLILAGYDDWRLPNLKELTFIVDYTRHDPSINRTYFPNTMPFVYWSSSPYAGHSYHAWLVNFYYGGVYNGAKAGHYYVRCVRGIGYRG